MIDLNEAIVRQAILHRVSSENRNCAFGNGELTTGQDSDRVLLVKLFVKPFLIPNKVFEFAHEIDIEYNVLFNLARDLYDGADFVETTTQIAQHLAVSSRHPNIKDGDVFVCKLENIKIGTGSYYGLGIYKFEDKEGFLETSVKNRTISTKFREGHGGRKAEKACLIIFAEEPYTLLIIDNNDSGTDYWQNEFINIRAKESSINTTSDVLSLTKEYITNQLTKEFDTTRADQIDLLNRSVGYFRSHTEFDMSDFVGEVFDRDDVRRSFSSFGEQYSAKGGVDLVDRFEISASTVKKQARIFKSVLKLDKNFHVYIHGNRDLIERGVDGDGRQYYKLYFENES